MNLLFPKEERKIIKETIQNFYNENKVLCIFIKIIVYIICAILFVYFLKFVFEIPVLSDDKGDWGTFGDYMGGVLNPIFAFASFMALLYTIKLQLEELQATREELKRSADAQETQLKIIKEQQFDPLVLNLLKTIQDTSEILKIIDADENLKDIITNETCSFCILYDFTLNEITINLFGSISKYLRLPNNHLKDIEEYIHYIQININKIPQIQSYCENIYLLLKLIDKYQYQDEENIFIEIIKRDIPHVILIILLIKVIGNKEYIPLFEKYKLFEYIPIKTNNLDELKRKGNTEYTSRGNYALIHIMNVHGPLFSKNKYYQELKELEQRSELIPPTLDI